MLFKLLALSLAILGLESCAPQQNFPAQATSPRLLPETLFKNMISDRPLYRQNVFVLVQLTTPPLLAHKSINDLQKQKLLSEQAQFLERIKKLSPQIEVVYRYAMVLNGFALKIPGELLDTLKGMGGVSAVDTVNAFARPQLITESNNTQTLPNHSIPNAPNDITQNNSSAFIGAQKVKELLQVPHPTTQTNVAVDGTGVRVGVIDTGIDYTHHMLGGSGATTDYTQNNPNIIEPGTFPNEKVVGGIDLVGTDYNSASPLDSAKIPKPDADPLDEGKHGTHVSGTIAGLGDGINSYNGVAHKADLWAIKVFGKEGSTSDMVVIAGLEFAADPNRDLNPDDALDVLNLSLGGPFGVISPLYHKAVSNLSNRGTVLVMSAGNSGPKPFIVGSPGTSPEAISVAASVDNMSHNWSFAGVSLRNEDASQTWKTELLEAGFASKLEQSSYDEGELVYVGLAGPELSPEQKNSLLGKVALIDRGKYPFFDKAKTVAEAGAIAAIVVNNVAGPAFVMSGDGINKLNIPVFMIELSIGRELKQNLAQNKKVFLQFKNGGRVERPEFIDTLTSFSSNGPRSIDGFIKPEISAPGQQIISALCGSGTQVVRLNGTSMAAPHITGVVALLKQKFPSLNAAEIKSLLMNTSKKISASNGQEYSVTQQGAGRVQAFQAATSNLVIQPAAISLGIANDQASREFQRSLKIKNVSAEPLNLSINVQSNNSQLALQSPQYISLAAFEAQDVLINYALTPSNEGTEAFDTLEGQIVITQLNADTSLPENKSWHVPYLLLLSHNSLIHEELIHSNSDINSYRLQNRSAAHGMAWPFKEIAEDNDTEAEQKMLSSVCNLQSAGYRLVRQNNQVWAEFAYQLSAPVTTWNLCDLSVLVDKNYDQVVDQELLFTARPEWLNTSDKNSAFFSILLDGLSMRQSVENWQSTGKRDETLINKSVLSSSGSTTSLFTSVAKVAVPLGKLALTPNGFLRAKLAATTNTDRVAIDDDYLGVGLEGSWHTLNFKNTPVLEQDPDITLKMQQQAIVEMPQINGAWKWYFPQNAGALN